MNKRNVVCYIIVLCYSFLICYNFLTPKLATDTYNIINIGLKEYAIQNSLTDGRLIMGGILLLINIIPNIEIEFLGTIFEFLAIIISCFVVLILYNITLNKKTSKIERIFNLICSYFIVFNFAYIENLYFMECFVMSLSLLFYLLSAKENISRNYLLSAIFLFLGLISYQGTISFYFTILLFLIINNEEKELKKRIIPFILIVGINFILAMLVPKLVCLLFHTSQTRLTNLLKNVLIILKRFGAPLIRTGGIIGKYDFIIILLEFLILIILKINYEKNKKIIYPKKIILILWSSIIFAYIPSILSSSAFEGMRIRMSIGMTIGLLFMYLGRNTTLLKLKEKNIFNILLIILWLFYITYTSYIYIYQEKTVHIVNELDKEFGEKLNDYIIEYEKENNIEIKYINLVVNAEEVEKSYYNEIKTYNIMTLSAFRTSWSAIGTVNYYTKRNLVGIKSYSNIKWYLENYDDSLGYLCKDGILYISIYYL